MDDESPKNSPVNSKSMTCDVCRKIFKTKSYLNVHKRIHSGENGTCVIKVLDVNTI